MAVADNRGLNTRTRSVWAVASFSSCPGWTVVVSRGRRGQSGCRACARAPRGRAARPRARAPARAGSRLPRGARASARRRRAQPHWTWRSSSRATAALDSFALPALELDEGDVEPRTSVGLGALDSLRDRRLARPQPLADLLDRTASLDRLRLQLVERLRDRGSGRLLELLAQPEHGLPLLAALEPSSAASASIRASTSATACRCFCSSRASLRLEVLLHAIDVVCERAKALLDRLSTAASSPASASRTARSRWARAACRLSASRRSSSSSREIESARSRASVRRISSTCVAVSCSTTARSCCAGLGDELVRRPRARAGAAQREREQDRDERPRR